MDGASPCDQPTRLHDQIEITYTQKYQLQILPLSAVRDLRIQKPIGWLIVCEVGDAISHLLKVCVYLRGNIFGAVYIHIGIYIHIYMYVHETYLHVYTYMYIHMYIYMYKYARNDHKTHSDHIMNDMNH